MNPVLVRHLGEVDCKDTYARMQEFNSARGDSTTDEIWALEHPPVYTLGLSGRSEHILDPGSIPVLQVDRGGQVTYHGPGQLVVYLLLDLKRNGLGIKYYVHLLEQAVIDLLQSFSIEASRRARAPGVYVDGRKIAALGVRVRRGCCYHGLSLNVDMDLGPFSGIHPCGYDDLEVTQLADLGIDMTVGQAADALIPDLLRLLELEPVAASSPSARGGPPRRPDLHA